jgi:hypothetical protein
LIAGISALSGALIAGIRNVTAQYAANGSLENFDWRSFGKDVGIAAVIGGATGALGAWIGGGLTNLASSSRIGSMFFGSSSSIVRMSAAALISGGTESIAGGATRFCTAGITSLLNDGTWDWDASWESATNVKDIVTDFLLGSAFGAGMEYKQIKADVIAQKYNTKNHPLTTAQKNGLDNIQTTRNYGADFANSDYILRVNNGGVSTTGQPIVVKIKATGMRRGKNGDFDLANKIALEKYGIDTSVFDGNGYTWHHLDDYNVRNGKITMELVETWAHKATVPHSGGCAQYKAVKRKKYK